MARSPVVPEATHVGALSALVRHSLRVSSRRKRTSIPDSFVTVSGASRGNAVACAGMRLFYLAKWNSFQIGEVEFAVFFLFVGKIRQPPRRRFLSGSWREGKCGGGQMLTVSDVAQFLLMAPAGAVAFCFIAVLLFVVTIEIHDLLVSYLRPDDTAHRPFGKNIRAT